MATALDDFYWTPVKNLLAYVESWRRLITHGVTIASLLSYTDELYSDSRGQSSSPYRLLLLWIPLLLMHVSNQWISETVHSLLRAVVPVNLAHYTHWDHWKHGLLSRTLDEWESVRKMAAISDAILNSGTCSRVAKAHPVDCENGPQLGYPKSSRKKNCTDISRFGENIPLIHRTIRALNVE